MRGEVGHGGGLGGLDCGRCDAMRLGWCGEVFMSVFKGDVRWFVCIDASHGRTRRELLLLRIATELFC